MTTQIIQGIKRLKGYLNNSSDSSPGLNKVGEKNALPPVLVSYCEEQEDGATAAIVEGAIMLSDPYTFALAAMPILDDRIKFSSFTTTTGQPIESLREWIDAAIKGELTNANPKIHPSRT